MQLGFYVLLVAYIYLGITFVTSFDIPINYLKWPLYLSEYYEYPRFEDSLRPATSCSLF